MMVNISGCWCNNHLEKYEFVNGVGMNIPYMKWTIKFMFEKHQPVIDAVYVVWLFTSWLYIHDYTLYLVYVCFLLVHLSQILP